MILIRVGREHRSVVLVADGKHPLTDVWTSAGVVVAVGAVALTGWEKARPDHRAGGRGEHPVDRLGSACDSVSGLLDERLSDEDIDEVVSVLACTNRRPHFHALQSRAAGRQRFVSLHMLVPGSSTVRAAQ